MKNIVLRCPELEIDIVIFMTEMVPLQSLNKISTEREVINFVMSKGLYLF